MNTFNSELLRPLEGLPPPEMWTDDIRQLVSAYWALTLERGRRDMLTFCRITKPDWMTAPHHLLLTSVADRLISGELRFVAISLPPRHTKSEIFSVRFPAYFFGRFPHKQLLHVSYAGSLSNAFSFQIREIIARNADYANLFPATALHPQRQRLDDWMTTAGGGFRSVGIGAGISGRGADGIIIDDPMQEGDENSPATMEQKYNWYASAARTRLTPNGFVVIPMTRWHPSDLIGRILDSMKLDADSDQFLYIRLPALSEGEGDPLERGEGQPLWPERYSRENLLALRAASHRYFEALFQQNPQPEASKLFFARDFRRVEVEDNAPFGVWAFDLAISDNESADFSAWARWIKAGDEYIVTSITRHRQEWPATKEAIIDLMNRYPRDWFVFPAQTYELVAVQELRALGARYARRLRQVTMKGDKRARAASFADAVAAGRVMVQHGAAGDAFIEEHDRFPDIHDDFVDMSSVAMHHLTAGGDFKALLGDTA
jgi:predicted phage terminase large subunit-like protein